MLLRFYLFLGADFPLESAALHGVVILTPELIVVGAAARLSTAVARFTQVARVVVDPRAVLGTDNRPAS